MPVFMPVFIILFVIAFLFIVGSTIARFIKNENSPVVATQARLLDKKCSTSTHTDANGMMHTSETLYLYFELDTGSPIKFSVNGRIYHGAICGEWGTLTFQGTRFLRFETLSGILEK